MEETLAVFLVDRGMRRELTITGIANAGKQDSVLRCLRIDGTSCNVDIRVVQNELFQTRARRDDGDDVDLGDAPLYSQREKPMVRHKTFSITFRLQRNEYVPF